MKKSKQERILNTLREHALTAPSGYANMQCHGSNIEAIRTARGWKRTVVVHFKIDGVVRSQFDIAAWLDEKLQEQEAVHRAELAKNHEMPNFTDQERLDFAMQTGAEWKRPKYHATGTLTWIGRGVNVIESDNYRYALDQAIRAFKLEGGVVLTPYARAYDPNRAVAGTKEIVVIFGPQGCGKTVNAPLFAKHYGGHCMDFDIFNYRVDKNVYVLFVASREEAEHAVDYCAKNCFVRPRIVAFSDALKECGK